MGPYLLMRGEVRSYSLSTRRTCLDRLRRAQLMACRDGALSYMAMQVSLEVGFGYVAANDPRLLSTYQSELTQGQESFPRFRVIRPVDQRGTGFESRSRQVFNLLWESCQHYSTVSSTQFSIWKSIGLTECAASLLWDRRLSSEV